MEPIRVLIADDHPLYRGGMRGRLDRAADVEVVGEAANGDEAVRMTRELEPDVVLMDIKMPGMSGIEAAEEINRLLPTTKIVMLTSSDEEEDVFEALKAGADGYILKDRLTDLPDAVRVVARDLGLLLSPSIASKVMTEFREGPRRPAGPGLTERELEVLRMVSRGCANQEIAEELTLSLHTVKRHVANIMSKLHQRSRLEAVMYALRSGVLAPEVRS